jgi:hypothetical protein
VLLVVGAMSDAASAPNSLPAALSRARHNVRALAVRASDDHVTTALVALLVAAWCSEGALALLGLPHGVVGLVDLAEVVLCVWLGARLVLDRAVPRIPVVVLVYGVWVGVGLVTHAPAVAVVTALKNALLLPVLALLLAARGTTERRATAVVGTLLALAAFEFLTTLVQWFRTSDSDAIVGSFGPSANAVTAAVILMVACVGVAGYLVGARYGVAGLAGAALLPLFSAWALVKIVPVLLPVVTLAVVVPALVLRQTSLRRAVVSAAAVAVSAGLVLASYAVFNPDSFQALFGSRAGSYLKNASISGQPALQRVRLNRVVMSNYANSSLAVTSAPGTASGAFRVANAESGDYTAWMAAADGTSIRVREHKRYVLRAEVGRVTGAPQFGAAQIEWHGRGGGVIATKVTNPVPLPGRGARYRRLVVSGVAPAGAVAALPKIAITGNPPAGSAVSVPAIRFTRATGRGVVPPGTQRPTRTVPRFPPPEASPRPVPGRLTQWRMAEHAISGSFAAELFGRGLGSATVADNLGVHPQDLSADAEAASYSDFGTLLVERGWTGVALEVLFALAIAGVACRIARVLPRARWTTALTLAVPGVVALMSAYGMIAEQLRNRPAALTFWLIVALGLSPGSFLGGRPWRSEFSWRGSRARAAGRR